MPQMTQTQPQFGSGCLTSDKFPATTINTDPSYDHEGENVRTKHSSLFRPTQASFENPDSPFPRNSRIRADSARGLYLDFRTLSRTGAQVIFRASSSRYQSPSMVSDCHFESLTTTLSKRPMISCGGKERREGLACVHIRRPNESKHG